MGLIRVLEYWQIVEEIEKNLPLYKQLYHTKGLTARKVAENQNIQYDNNFQKALCRLLPKNMGRGGARLGSGNKKGVKLKK